MKQFRRYMFLFVKMMACCLIAFILGIFIIYKPYSYGKSNQIPTGWGSRIAVPMKGTSAYPCPISVSSNPANPYLAASNSKTMHVDSYASDAHPQGGPLGINPQVISYAHSAFGGECACVTFDSNGNIVAVFGSFREFALLLISPRNLKVLARIRLPGRKSNRSFNIRKIVNDTSGGAYFFLDNQNRAVLIDANQVLKIVSQKWHGDKVHFEVTEEYSLFEYLLKYTRPDDTYTSVLPDWKGRYWFVSRYGMIGVLNPLTHKISFLCLDHEEIQNSFAVDSAGTYIVSDRALYGLTTRAESDTPYIAWREAYETASMAKKGSITLGSGTTPTLLGSKYIAIADNADPQIHVLVYRRGIDYSGQRLVCKIPVFEAGKSATENSLIGVNNSLIVENNFGYDLLTNMILGRTGTGGIVRVDFTPETGEARVVWSNPLISQTTVPKISLENGLVYVYTKDPSVGWGIDAYYLSAIDFQTGKTRFEIHTGTGVSFDNNWAPITLGPDNSAYIGVLKGLVKVFDGDSLKGSGAK